MLPNDRQKMCSSCDGRVPIEASICPYCAAEQSSPAPAHAQQHHSFSQSLYPPPYAQKGSPHLGDGMHNATSFKSQPQEPMHEKRFQPSAALGVPNINVEGAVEQQVVEEKSSFWPLLLMSIGANLLVLGLLQLFFSENGTLTLEWNSHFWFLYCLGAAPLFYLGFKKASNLS